MLRRDKMLFPFGKDKAVTFSFDDGVTQDINLIELMDKYNVKCTFNINSGKFGLKDTVQKMIIQPTHNKINREDIKDVYKNHEIAVHGYDHISLTEVSSEVKAYEIGRDKYELEKLLEDRIKGMAYAFGRYDEDTKSIMRLLKLRYGRTVKSTYNFNIPKDFLEWNPTCKFNDKEIMNITDRFLENNGRFETKLLYIWGHSYELDGLILWDHMEEVIRKISGHDDIWYATNGEIEEYVRAYRSLEYSMDGKKIYNDSNMDIWVEIAGVKYKIKSGSNVTIPY